MDDQAGPMSSQQNQYQLIDSQEIASGNWDEFTAHGHDIRHRGKGVLPAILEETEEGGYEDADFSLDAHPQDESTALLCQEHGDSVVEEGGVIRRTWDVGWTVVHHNHLPEWLRDNDFLIKGHRPPLYSFLACLQSIFRIHTETGNIWTHLLGCVAFIGSASYVLTRPFWEVQWREKALYSAFFLGVICCLFFSTFFHTFLCHSKRVNKLFNKLDYCGIAVLCMTSFVPWLNYSFYCRIVPKIAYNLLILVLGLSCIAVSMWDKFAAPKFRPVRAGVFIGLGLSGVIPVVHFVITDGFHAAVHNASLGWLVIMSCLYIGGAVIYAFRVPESVWPGKFDIWFQSHQLFHVCVVAGAYTHFHGISVVTAYRMTFGDCDDVSDL